MGAPWVAGGGQRVGGDAGWVKQRRRPNTGTAIDIYNSQISSVAQDFTALAPQSKVFCINSGDVKVRYKSGYMLNAVAKLGLSGGPMLDAVDGKAVGLCFIGLPANVHQKTQIGAIDIWAG